MGHVFSQQGLRYFIKSKESLSLLDTLDAVTLSIKYDSMLQDFYLERVDDFTLPVKRYGDNDVIAERVLTTFLSRKKATGALFAGEKGSGKSVCAKTIAVMAQQRHGMPVILVNEPLAGTEFFSTIQNISQPAVVLFDEFEKIYSNRPDVASKEQQEVLTLLDGMYPSNKLYLFTVNNKWAIDSNMRNRPGRIFYSIDYSGLDSNFITAYCEDNLNDKTQIDSVIKVSHYFNNFNFDMLQALVEEMNRYAESAIVALKYLNIKVEYESDNQYTYTVQMPGVPDNLLVADDRTVKLAPFTRSFVIDVRKYKKPFDPLSKAKNDYEYSSHVFDPSDIKHVNPANKELKFVNSSGVTVLLKPYSPLVRADFAYAAD